MPCDLIIFDCDGTLVDSEHAHCTVILDLVRETTGLDWTPEYLLENATGFGIARTQVFIEEQGGVRLPPDFTARYIERAVERLPALCRATAHAEEVLAALSLPYCLASNGEEANILAALHGTGLSGFFPPERIFHKAMVPRPKPAPDLFLHAAQTLGARPERCLVIEDSPTGVRAGKAAGMRVAGYTGAAHDAPASYQALTAAGADVVIESLMQVINEILADALCCG